MSVQPIAPLPWQPPRLVNHTYTPMNPSVGLRFLSEDRKTVYGTRGTTLVKTIDDGTTWTTVTDFGAGISSVAGAWRLPNGNFLMSNKVGGGKGSLRWCANPTAATPTWAQATVGGQPLTMSRNDNLVHESWGLSYAPKGHPREGLVVCTEYGGQGAAADLTTDPTLTPKIWFSTDYGRTFKVIGDLYTLTGISANQHMHGVVFDPYADKVVVNFGDGNGSVGAKTGVMECADFTSDTPTWKWVYGPVVTADYQPTTMFPTPGGLVMGGDGAPPGIYRLPLNQNKSYGPIQTVLNHGGGTDTGWIGQLMVQAAPGEIVLISHQLTKNYAYPNVINAMTADGARFFELFRDSSKAAYPSSTAVGPTATGKILATINNDGRAVAPTRTFMVADLLM